MKAMPDEQSTATDATVVDFSSQEPPSHLVPEKRAVWHGICAQHLFVKQIDEGLHCCPKQLTVSIHLGRPVKLDWQLVGGCKHFGHLMTPGDCHISPSEVPAWWRHSENKELFLIALEPALLSRAAQETIAADRVEIIQTRGIRDPILQKFGQLFQAELDSGGLGGQLYAESLANALSIHLLRCYSTSGKPIYEPMGGLPQYKLREAIEYINDHLEQELTLSEMAARVQMNPHYFSRLFKQSVGVAPHQYVIQCRVERAKQLLLKGEITIADVAYKVGFANQSHLNRHFKRLVGVTPKAIHLQK